MTGDPSCERDRPADAARRRDRDRADRRGRQPRRRHALRGRRPAHRARPTGRGGRRRSPPASCEARLGPEAVEDDLRRSGASRRPLGVCARPGSPSRSAPGRRVASMSRRSAPCALRAHDEPVDERRRRSCFASATSANTRSSRRPRRPRGRGGTPRPRPRRTPRTPRRRPARSSNSFARTIELVEPHAR